MTLAVNETGEKCKEHGDLLEYFCPQCEEVICAACTCDPQHEQHCNQIVDVKTGLQGLKASMNKICHEFMENAKMVEECAEMFKKDTDSLKVCKDALSAKCQDVETILNQMKGQLKVITELYQHIRSSYQEINTHFEDVQNQMSEIKNLQHGSDTDFIGKVKECRRNCDRVMNDTQMILNRKITFPENIKQNIKIIGDVGQIKTMEVCLKEKLMAKTKPEVTQREKLEIKSDTQQVPRSSPRQTDKNIELNDPQLLLEIKPGRTVDMKNPLEVVSVGDGTVILVDSGLKYLQRINTEGEVVTKYQVTVSQQVRYQTACVFSNYLFVATSDNVITKMSLDGSNHSITYKPEGIRETVYISAIGDNVILISGGGLTGYDYRISEYNTETNQVIERVGGIIWHPGKVSVVKHGDDNKYIVKCKLQRMFKSVVKFYNRNWSLICTIDIGPDVLTVTPGGKLLLVNDNRILEYNQDGTFIKRLLDKYKFKGVQDITCDGGCLWVCEVNPFCIKMFVAN